MATSLFQTIADPFHGVPAGYECYGTALYYVG